MTTASPFAVGVVEPCLPQAHHGVMWRRSYRGSWHMIPHAAPVATEVIELRRADGTRGVIRNGVTMWHDATRNVWRLE